jgi:hypothetical protein
MWNCHRLDNRNPGNGKLGQNTKMKNAPKGAFFNPIFRIMFRRLNDCRIQA